MYGSILTFLIAIVIQALAPRLPEAAWTWSEAIHILIYPLAVWALLRFRFRRLMARALHDEAAVRDLRIRFAGLIQAYQGLLLAPFALLVYATRYASLVIEPAARASEVLGAGLGVAPFLFFLCVLWWEAYPLQGVLLGRSGTRAGFVVAHARMEFPVLVPWLALMGISDLFRWVWPGAYAQLEANPLLQLLYAPVFLVLLGVFLPVLVKSMWGCEPVPPGPLRERLEALCRSLGLRVGEILYWPLLEGRVLTAGIVGLLPRFRYLLVTPALARALPGPEMDGVVAHEAGHVRYRHLWFYLLFFAGYVCLVAIFFRFAEAALAWWGLADPEALRQPRANLYASVGMTLGLLVLLVAYFRVLFGAVSRAFERQADAYALEVIGRPDPLVSALERISLFSGDIRDLPSWHHGSIAERVRFLLDAARDPRALQAHHRRVRRMTALFALGVATAAALAVALNAGPLDRGFHRFVAEAGLAHRVRENPRDALSWFALGNLYLEEGREAEAARAYEQALLADPRNPEALNNLAWLHLTAKDPALRRPERALVLAELAVQLKPAAHIWDTLAEARFQVHDVRGALAAIEVALSRRPDNRDYYLAQREKFRRALEDH
ncbi:MAG: hypothetical protein Kow0092_32300 [Deferrisomatales bacterium]